MNLLDLPIIINAAVISSIQNIGCGPGMAITQSQAQLRTFQNMGLANSLD